MKVIAPRLPTRVSLGSGTLTSRLPDDILAEQIRRLGVFAAVASLTIFLRVHYTKRAPHTAGLAFMLLNAGFRRSRGRS